MGRTLPSYRQRLESIIREWNRFRRVLPKGDREIFDELMLKARKHADASSYDARLNPMESFFMSILVEIEKELRDLKVETYGIDR